MKTFVSLILMATALTSAVSRTSLAAETLRDQLVSFRDGGTIFVHHGCSKKVLFFKKYLDCYGIVLHDVIVRKQDGNKSKLDEVVFPIASLDASEAQTIIEKIREALAGSESAAISELRYLAAEQPLSVATKDPNDRSAVHLGGITVRWTEPSTMTIAGGMSVPSTQTTTLSIGVK